jgi:hypothetical protein
LGSESDRQTEATIATINVPTPYVREYSITDPTLSDLVLLHMVPGIVEVELYEFDGTLDDFWWYARMLMFATPPKKFRDGQRDSIRSRMSRVKL